MSATSESLFGQFALPRSESPCRGLRLGSRSTKRPGPASLKAYRKQRAELAVHFADRILEDELQTYFRDVS